MLEALRSLLIGDAPVFVLIAGPNGAGKSTFRQRRLEPIGFPCIDPDAVCQELFSHHASSIDEALTATKEATHRVRELFAQRKSVALESVFSDTHGHKLALLSEAHELGFKTVLVFIGVDHPQVSIARVTQRRDSGGHDVPDEVIEDRFPRCFENLKKGLRLADVTVLIDNTGALRHEVFGRVVRGLEVELETNRPRWYTDFRIDVVVEQVSEREP